MAVQQFKLSTVEMESFTDESIKVCLLQVQKGDKIMAEKCKLSTADHPRLWICFRCEAVFHKETHLHYHQNICLHNLTNSSYPKKRQLTLHTFQ